MMMKFTSRSSSDRFPSCMPCAAVVSVCILIHISASEELLPDQYIGCFYDTHQTTDINASISTDKEISIQKCILKCKALSKTYAALQNGNICHCRNDYGVQLGLSDSSCYLICSGNENQICGGFIGQRITYSLYTVCLIGTYGAACDKGCHCKRDIPCDRMTGNCSHGCYGNWSGPACNMTTKVSHQYIGCYGDDHATRAMEFRSTENKDNNTPQLGLCAKSCADKNYSYAGLQYSVQCFCGDIYDGNGESKVCNMPCPGDSDVKCGGLWAISVYSVCPIGNYRSSCAGRCRCYNGRRCIFRNGSCPSSRCETGWTGASCNIRDCNQSNGDCFTNEECAVINLTYSTVSVCRCPNGFQGTSLRGNCADIDECSLNMCDADTMICTNTVGSYSCSCKSGFQANNATACIEVEKHSTATSTGAIGAAVGSISAVVVVVTIALSLLFCYRNRKRKSSNDNELQPNATTIDMNPSSSPGSERERGIDSDYMSIDEESSLDQFPERGGVYAGLTTAKFRIDESRIYAHLANAKVSIQK